MRKASWFRTMAEWLSSGSQGARLPRRSESLRLRLEALEERCVPATFTVLNNLDAGTGSLRAAITAANLTAAADTIVFDPSLVGKPITLATALPQIANPLTITGLGQTSLTISGNQAVQPFSTAGGVAVTITDLTITKGSSAANGGAIDNLGSLTLTNVTISQSAAAVGGGGIENETGASLTISNSLITENTANGGAGIGAGGGIDNFAVAILTDTTISDNVATDRGAGFENRSGATSSLTRCTISENVAAAEGGGIRNISTSGSAMQIINSTIADNISRSGTGGGGISSIGGTITILNCTIAKNTDVSAAASGAGGISLIAPGLINLTNTILADNFHGTAANNNRNTTTGFTDTSNLIGDASVVGPLQNNGGPTLTMLPLAGIDSGNAAAAASLTNDQRGFLRLVGTKVDIGAVEFQPPLTTTTLAVTPATNPSPFGIPITVTAAVTPSAAAPNNVVTGTVSFLNGTTVLGTGTLDATGHASFTTAIGSPLPVGSDSITARYEGDVNFSKSVSTEFTQVVALPTITPGNFDPTTDTWSLRTSNTAGSANIPAFSTGGSGLLPITGDWNGTGVFTPGTYDPATGTFKLYNTYAAGAAPFATFQFGPATGNGIPVAGDWNGSGKYGIGVFDPTQGIWDLRNELSGGIPDAGNLNYGAIGSKPVVGDWNGDGVTDLGVVEPDGTWKLKNTPTIPQTHQVTGPPDFTFKFGLFTDQVFAGDWNGDGIWSPGVIETVNGATTWLERNSNSAGGADNTFAFGSTANLPVVGSWKFP